MGGVYVRETAFVSVEREVRILWRSTLLELESYADLGIPEPLRMYLMAGSERKFMRCGPMFGMRMNAVAKEVFK